MAQYYKAGIGAVGNYQVSGVPYITGSGAGGLGAGVEDKVEFPYVAKSVMVMLNDTQNDDLRIHFNATGSGNVVNGNHYFTLSTNRDSITFNTKCKEIYISNPSATSGSGYTVVAELTTIQTSEMYTLTGSGLTD
jgi:hypothetical protein